VPLLRDVRDQLGSPYLREHADNPVQWWEWGADALATAAARNQPIFLSVGYAACHWCHVMAHESFTQPQIAALLNDSFVSIKVDREERPDVDALYMSAAQLMTGRGGWPLSVFLLPDGRPFMAGTYYPPDDRDGTIGFPRLLRALANAWAIQRDAVVAQADELTDALARDVAFVDHLVSTPTTALDLVGARSRLRARLIALCDPDGGFGPAPKFPRARLIDALSEFDDDDARAAVTRTLEAMARRGLYDHLGAGFARYSVDAAWRVPHFEKMLSDQALLARTYLWAARRLEGNSQWREVALATLQFCLDELATPDGLASSLDADAGGVEGSHVTWRPEEVADALRARGLVDDIPRALARWSIPSSASLDGRTVPTLADGEPFRTPDALRAAHAALREWRARRPAPRRDDKVVLEWNAYFASACLVSNEAPLVARALDLLTSLETTHRRGAQWWRTQFANVHATAADVAALGDAMIDAYEATGADEWLARAVDLAHYLFAHHWDGEVPSAAVPHVGRGVFTSSDLAADLPLRPKDLFDGVTPSSHGLSARLVARLALCTGDPEWAARARRLVELVGGLLRDHPDLVVDSLDAAGFALDGVGIVVPGATQPLSDHVRWRAVPRSVLVVGTGTSPLLAGRASGVAYVCRAGVCARPAESVADLDAQLRALSA
jgi:uncharacterized protein YyaL (SSP411 family)